MLSLKAPNLESLELWCGMDDDGGDCDLETVRPLFQSGRWPKLKRLALMNATFTDEIAAALTTSPILPTLSIVDLSMGCLTDAGAKLIIEHKDAFKHLELLNLSVNALETMDDANAFAGVAKKVDIEVQEAERAEEGSRSTSVGE